MFRQLLVSLVLSASVAFTAPVDGEVEIARLGIQLPHDQVRTIPESLPNDAVGRAMKRFQPYINTEGGGCVPFPAVDSEGDYGAGLAIGGSQSGSCGSSEGQAYVRGGWFNGKYALYYSWYYPKDQTQIGIGGHRHDWEGAVVWIDDPAAANPKILGAAASAHGDFNTLSPVPSSNIHSTEGRVLLRYWCDVPVFGTHSIGFTSKIGRLQPLVAWDSLSANAKLALESVNWGSASFPLSHNFDGNLAKAQL